MSRLDQFSRLGEGFFFIYSYIFSCLWKTFFIENWGPGAVAPLAKLKRRLWFYDCITCTEVHVWKKCAELMSVATQFYKHCHLVKVSGKYVAQHNSVVLLQVNTKLHKTSKN